MRWRWRAACGAGLAVAALASSAGAARNLALTAASEEGFRRFMRMAQAGELGGDVSNANVRIEHTQARIELVRRDGKNAVLLLTPKHEANAPSRYFDIAPGGGASRADVARVGRALDAAFIEDPFRLTGFEEPPAGEAIPSLSRAWEHGSWRAVLRVLERRLMVLPGLAYTGAVIVALGLGLFATLALLWTAAPPPAAGAAGTDQSSSPRAPI